jgi:hypothetical protein
MQVRRQINLDSRNPIPFQCQVAMDQIAIKTPNPKMSAFLKIGQQRYLAAGVYLSEAPYPLPPRYTLNEYMYPCIYLFTQGRGGGGVFLQIKKL